jgi:hypothetical protein
MTPALDDYRRWEERAEEARVLAEAINSPETKRIMLEVAEGYLRLARRARNKAMRKMRDQERVA